MSNIVHRSVHVCISDLLRYLSLLVSTCIEKEVIGARATATQLPGVDDFLSPSQTSPVDRIEDQTCGHFTTT